MQTSTQTTVQTNTHKSKTYRPTNQNFAHGKGRQHIHKPDRDPILEIVCHAIQESRLTNKKIAELSGITPQTISRWQNYDLVRRPQFFTVNAVMQALGYQLKFTRNH